MEIIEMITAIVSLLIAVVTSVIAILTKIKAAKSLEKVTEDLFRIQTISDKINEYAIIAEANGGTGEEKKQFVLNSIKAICEQYDWAYNEDWVSETLEVLIDLTKKINHKGAE